MLTAALVATAHQVMDQQLWYMRAMEYSPANAVPWTDPNLLNQIWAGVGGGLVGNLEVHGCNWS